MVFTGVVGLVGGTLVVVACSDNSTTTSSGGVPSVDDNRDTGSSGSSGNPNPPPPPPGDDGGGDGAGPDCTYVPKIRDNSTGFFCAFVDKVDAGPDGGDNRYCTATQICCDTGDTLSDGGHEPSFCGTDAVKPAADETATCAASAATFGSTFTKGSTYECGDKSNCGAGQFCVLYSTGLTFKALNTNGGHNITGCGAVYASATTSGSKCVPGNYTLQAGDYHLCGTTDTCAAGTCTPFSEFFRDMAYCK
ncbi:MAG TPA: hypothetical protein VIF62_40045 [Labilithrix sp.]